MQRDARFSRPCFAGGILALLALLVYGCTGLKRSAVSSSNNPFANGANIGWLQQMEATGYTFYNEKGEPEDSFKILKDRYCFFANGVKYSEIRLT